MRGTAKEAKRGDFSPPFYRMHLRSRRISDQHQSLISLEQTGNEVFYVAPSFHTTAELNTSYARRQVWDRSFRVRPSAIGPLPNDKGHHVTFQQPNGRWRFYSEDPSREGRGEGTEEIATSLAMKIKERGSRNLREQISELDSVLHEIVTVRNTDRNARERINIDELGPDFDPLTRVSYIARQFFGCQLLFVTFRG